MRRPRFESPAAQVLAAAADFFVNRYFEDAHDFDMG
jgi:hypothetical protein